MAAGSWKTACNHRGATARTGKQLAPPRGHRTYRKTTCITAGPPHVPENTLHHRGATVITGPQPASNGRQLTPPRRDGKRPASARNARARASRDRTGKQLAPPRGHRTYRKTACTTVGSSHVSENSLHHRGPTARTGKQLASPRGHRTYRNTACTTAGPPHVPEHSLHQRGATASTGTQLAQR